MLVLDCGWKEGGLWLKNWENVDKKDSSMAKGHGRGVG